MAELIQQYVERIRGAESEYIVRACGEQRADGTWNGWLEFHDATDSHAPFRSLSSTRHPDHGALTRWAAGLEKRDFARAFEARIVPTPEPVAATRPHSG